MEQELAKLVKELGGTKRPVGINWCWLEFPSEEAATTVVNYLKDAEYERPEYVPGWRPDNEGKHFVKFHW